jgi:hypothetical protein
MVNGNKGFISLLLIFLFLAAGLTRNLIFTLPSIHKAEASHFNSSSKYLLTAATGEESGQSFLDQLKDSDADDVEVLFFSNYITKLIIPPAAKHEFSDFTPYRSLYRVPLYDLYCNWKFHLP